MKSGERALILGIGGQDGSYLADILHERGYEVHGLYRRSSVDNLQRLGDKSRFTLHQGDITDPASVLRVLCDVPAIWTVYNMADQDDVGPSYKTPGYSYDVTAKAPAELLELIRIYYPHIRFFQPCSATMFGDAPAPQTLDTPLNPLSPYACAKAAAYHTARYYRQIHGMYVSTAVMYSHDSPRRGPGYLLQQIARQAIAVAKGECEHITVGDPDMSVDIGYAGDFMSAVANLMQCPTPGDVLLGSGPCLIGSWCLLARRVLEDILNSYAHALSNDGLVKTDKKLLRPGPQIQLTGGVTAKIGGAVWQYELMKMIVEGLL